MHIGGIGPATFGLNMNGTINGNTYTGTAGFTQSGALGAPAGTVTSSALDGGFYGANASETAGAVRVEGRAPDRTGNPGPSVVVTGAFGATKR